MKTNAKERAWMKAEAEEHGCMEPQRFCDSFNCTTVHRLIADVDDAKRLLVAMYNNAPSADEFRLMVRTMGRTTEAAEAFMPQIDRLEKAEVEVVTFLKEPRDA